MTLINLFYVIKNSGICSCYIIMTMEWFGNKSQHVIMANLLVTITFY